MIEDPSNSVERTSTRALRSYDFLKIHPQRTMSPFPASLWEVFRQGARMSPLNDRMALCGSMPATRQHQTHGLADFFQNLPHSHLHSVMHAPRKHVSSDSMASQARSPLIDVL